MRTIEEVRKDCHSLHAIAEAGPVSHVLLIRWMTLASELLSDIPDLLSALAAKDEEIRCLKIDLEKELAVGEIAHEAHVAELAAKDAEIEQWRTADSEAVKAQRAEIEKLRGVLEDAWYQFAYVDGNGERFTGGLSALEDIADVLEIDE